MHKDDKKIVSAHATHVHRPTPHQVQQWHDAIHRAARSDREREYATQRSNTRKALLWGALVSAAVLVGIIIGAQMPNTQDSPSESQIVNTRPPVNVMPVAFTRGLSLHLRQSQQHLNSFNSSSESAQLIRQIIEQNRVFEAAADQHDAANVARLLRAFEPILLRLAADDIAHDDAHALRAQLEFELKVMLTKLARQSSDQSQST